MQETHDLFLCADSEIGLPIVRVLIPPETRALWPEALFVPPDAAEPAVAYVLRYGLPNPALHWIGAGDFPRGEP